MFPLPPQPAQAPPKPEQKEEQNFEKNSCIEILFERQYQLVKQPKHLMMFLGALGLFFLILAIVTAVLVLRVKQVEVEYAQIRKCQETGLETDKCSVKFKVDQDMEGPVYLLYNIKNVYTNHRRFLNSYNTDQLAGKAISADDATKQCGLYVYNKNIPQKTSWMGQTLNPEDIASLCGAKPQGYFNDTYSLYRDGQPIAIEEAKVQSPRAINSNRGPNSESTQWIDPQSEHFKEYMLDGSLMTKKRVWGVLNNGLKAGEYTLLAANNYQMAKMKILKGIVLTTSTIMGGKEFFYPIAFGILCLLCIAFIIFLRISFSEYGKLRRHDKLYRI